MLCFLQQFLDLAAFQTLIISKCSWDFILTHLHHALYLSIVHAELSWALILLSVCLQVSPTFSWFRAHFAFEEKVAKLQILGRSSSISLSSFHLKYTKCSSSIHKPHLLLQIDDSTSKPYLLSTILFLLTFQTLQTTVWFLLYFS